MTKAEKQELRINKLEDRNNFLELRSTELTLIEETEAWEVNTYNEAIDAWIEVHLKVNNVKNEQSKSWYKDKLMKIHTLFRRHEKVLFDKKRLEVQYKKLYDMYQQQVELNRNLQKDFERSETT